LKKNSSVFRHKIDEGERESHQLLIGLFVNGSQLRESARFCWKNRNETLHLPSCIPIAEKSGVQMMEIVAEVIYTAMW